MERGERALRTRIIGLLAATAVLAGLGATLSAEAPANYVAAKPCSSGWTHAVIEGEHKCLQVGKPVSTRQTASITTTASIVIGMTQAWANTA